MVLKDPLETLRSALAESLADIGGEPQADVRLAETVSWRPHLYEPLRHRAWYVVPATFRSAAWLRRMYNARDSLSDLKLGVCAPDFVLHHERTLLELDHLGADILRAELEDDGARIVGEVVNASDLVYEEGLQLRIESARTMLDRGLERARAETDANRKGVLLELTAAVMLSQVRGFRVRDVRVSRRGEQIDITVLNRNVGNALLQNSPLVITEAKNWNRAVGPVEYAWLRRKLVASRGRAKLGFFVTTDRFTDGVYTEAIRDSKEEELIVLLDGKTFPSVWRDHDDITEGVEAAVYSAVMDHEV